MMLSLTMALLQSLVLAHGGAGTQASVEKLHPYLRQQIENTAPDQELPVYFVMRDKLHYADFRPRILHMTKAERRSMVMDVLKAHMEATQTELMDYLHSRPASDVTVISRNWLGNFVRVKAKPSVILGGAAIDGVSQVWYDDVPPLSQVEDVAPPAPRATPGNGPLDTRADEVWTTGIRGAGVVWINTDEGVRASQTSITSIHPGLTGKLWVNPGEIFNNGVDDDGDGKIDDYYGWNFGTNTNNIDDRGGHGTNTTGVFVGFDPSTDEILGNCPAARIMIGAINNEADQWDAIQYGIERGADGQTSSYSFKVYFNPAPNYAMHRDVGETSLAAGLIRTNSTSNDGSLCNSSSTGRKPFNISAPGCLPPPWLHPDQTLMGRLGGVLGIGAHDVGSAGPTQPSYTPCGPFAWYLPDLQVQVPNYPTSNWDPTNDNDYPWIGGSMQGLIKPDLTGPTGTKTTSGQTGYTIFSGTSNATPSVSSCLALALSANMSATPEDMAMAAQTTAVDYGPAGKDNKSGAGKLDAYELTKMVRAIHRINGDVAAQVTVSAASSPTVDLQIDSIPSTSVYSIVGLGPAHQVAGELTVRVQNPVLIASGTTDAQGDYTLSIPITKALVGVDVWTQFIVNDASFGPYTGSNAIHLVVTP